jgi:hypothetical protein
MPIARVRFGIQQISQICKPEARLRHFQVPLAARIGVGGLGAPDVDLCLRTIFSRRSHDNSVSK